MPLIHKVLATLALGFFAVEYIERHLTEARRRHAYNLDDRRKAYALAIVTGAFAFAIPATAIWSR